MSLGKARVKSVLSGDTVLLKGLDDSRGPPPEKLLGLASLSAPRVGNRNGKDEPFAWASREFLRKKVIGQIVTFRVEYTNASRTRECGTIFIGADNMNVSNMVVEEGWAKVIKGGSPEMRAIEHDELSKLEQAAVDGQKGLWTTAQGAAAQSVREVQYSGYDANELLVRCKGTPQPAIIEQISSASTFRVLLIPSFHHITLFLSGIQSPGFKRDESGAETAAPYAREGKYFVESRLLNRDVQVMLEGLDKNGNFFGTLQHERGNITQELIKNGLAKITEWSLSLTTSDVGALRMAEKAAREGLLRLWRDHVPKQVGPEFIESQAKVVEVVSGDTVIVIDTAGEEKRMVLSSVRAPRQGNPRAKEQEKQAPEPYAVEAREFLRKTLIGKKVKVSPEYSREFEQANGSVRRTFGSIFLGERNVAELLMLKGLATVARHNNAEERSMHYEELLNAEQTAMTNKAGMHSSKEYTNVRSNDLTLPTTKSKAKEFLSFLQRANRMKAVVEYVINGARFKLRIPKENCTIMFALAGVRCPGRARDGQPAEPYAEEALAFSRLRFLQREVEVEVETIDKGGTFLGSLYAANQSASLGLLEAGLSKRNLPSAEYSPYASELQTAEEVAKNLRKKVWENYTGEPEPVVETEPTEPKGDGNVMEIRVTEIINGGKFWGHILGEQGAEFLQQQLDNLALQTAADNSSASSDDFKATVGILCCALYALDGQWYRAKVVKGGATSVQVLFIDYGNTETIPLENMRPLDPASLSIPAQAHEFLLSYVKVPELEEEYGEESAHYLSGMVWDKELLAKVHMQQGKQFYATLFEKNDGTNINKALVAAGLARADPLYKRRAAKIPAMQTLMEVEEKAKTKRAGMWVYGDIGDEDDAKEFGMGNKTAAGWAKK